MTNKFEDLDLDMDDIQGDVSSVSTEKKQGPLSKILGLKPKKATENKPVKDEWPDVIARLESHLRKTWICLPEIKDGKLHVTNKELTNCSGEEFMQWVNLMWPVAKGKHTPEEYAKKKVRDKSFGAVFALVQSMKMTGHWKS